SCFLDNNADICPAHAFHDFCKSLKVHVICKIHFPCVNFKDFDPSFLIRERNLDRSVKPAGPEKSRIKQVNSVGCSNHFYIAFRIKAVHLRKELKHCPVYLGRATCSVVSSHAADSIDLIYEEDTRGFVSGKLKNIFDKP